MTTRKERGSESQSVVAAWFAAKGWPGALPVGAGRGGADITGLGGLHVEVKARRDLNITGWLRQAETSAPADGIPLLIYRPDGYGPARIGGWPAVMTLRTMTELLTEAGHCEPGGQYCPCSCMNCSGCLGYP